LGRVGVGVGVLPVQQRRVLLVQQEVVLLVQ
jgi:hypothetical protein